MAPPLAPRGPQYVRKTARHGSIEDPIVQQEEPSETKDQGRGARDQGLRVVSE